jgi:TonB-linked outer membrane protein, SusC/RagA family
MAIIANSKATARGMAFSKLSSFERATIRQLTVIMKLTTVFLLAFCMHVAAKTRGQNITLSIKDAPLEKVFQEIKHQTGYVFFYNDKLIENSKPISIEAKNWPLKKVLDFCFKDQPLTYSIKGKIITLTSKQIQDSFSSMQNDTLPLANKTVKGRLFGTSNEPVVGATIEVKGMNKQTFTNDAGEFSIEGLTGKETLIVTSINYERTEIPIRDRLIVKQALKIRTVGLAEVAVTVSTGYQELARERATGSYSTPQKDVFDSRVSTTVLSRLEGITSGLVFNPPGVTLDNNQKISIRGRSTIYANDDPLVVVDNFPYDGDINNLNPNDIASIDVLKDASAASIWGSNRSGNGVIVITTKKGKANQGLSINLNSNVTVSKRPDLKYDYNWLSTSDFINIERQLFDSGFYDSRIFSGQRNAISPVVNILNKSRTGMIPEEEANSQIEELRKYDVRDFLSKYFYRQAINQQYSLNLAGGSEKANYYLSFGYDKNLNAQKENGVRRYTILANTNFEPIKNLELTTGINYTQVENSKDNTLEQINTGSLYTGIYPYAALADNQGNPLSIVKDYAPDFVEDAPSKGFMNWTFSPLEELRKGLNTSKSTLADTRLSLGIKYTVIEGLNAEVKYQYQRSTNQQNSLAKQDSYYARNLINGFSTVKPDTSFLSYNIPLGGILNGTTINSEAQRFRSQLSYKLNQSKHYLSALAGFEISEVKQEGTGFSQYGYDEELGTSVPINLQNAFPIIPTGTYQSIPYNYGVSGNIDRFRSFFGTSSYTYDDRYSVFGSIRYDGANYFGVKANQKNIPLWSSGFRWNVHREDFFKSASLSSLSLKGSYGFNGNFSRNLSGLTTFVYYGGGAPITNAIYAAISNVGNPELGWEKTRIINIGAEFSLKRLLSGSFEFYFKRGKDLIGKSPFPPSSGINNLTGNYSEMKGKGIDVQLNFNIINKIAKWRSTFFLSFAKDEITKYQGNDVQPSSLPGANSYAPYPVVGKPVFGIWSYKSAGLDPANGDPRGYDSEKQISTDYNNLLNPKEIDELRHFGSARPVWFGGLTNVFNYKRFSLTVSISYKMGYFFIKRSINYYSLYNYWVGNREFTNRWRNPGDEAHTSVPAQRFPADQNRDQFYNNSESNVRKADHIRLQDISLSYNIAGNIANALKLKEMKLYVYMNNIGILWRSNNEGIDPDFPTGGIVTPRSISFGLRISL